MEDEGAGDFGDFGDSLLRRLCLDAVAVGEYAPFGEVRLPAISMVGRSSEHKATIDKRAGCLLALIIDCVVAVIRYGPNRYLLYYVARQELGLADAAWGPFCPSPPWPQSLQELKIASSSPVVLKATVSSQ